MHDLIAKAAFIGILCGAGTARAGATEPPMTHATLAADGQYSLILHPDVAWVEAEITVGDDATRNLGPATADAPVRVDGYTDGGGPLRITLQAVTGDHSGVTWMFEVDPEGVPVAAQRVQRRQRRVRLFSGR